MWHAPSALAAHQAANSSGPAWTPVGSQANGTRMAEAAQLAASQTLSITVATIQRDSTGTTPAAISQSSFVWALERISANVMSCEDAASIHKATLRALAACSRGPAHAAIELATNATRDHFVW
eukprot:12701371-Heterocapsa_arctica.AAC.1